MVELVAENQIILSEESSGDCFVGIPAAHEAERRFRPHQPSTGLFQRAVNCVGTADKAYGGCAGTELVQRGFARGDNLRLGAQTEIVVGGQNDDVAASFHANDWPLGTFEVVEPLVDPGATEFFQLLEKPRVERARVDGAGHAPISRITLPASPSLIT